MHILVALGLVWIWKRRSYREFLSGEGVLSAGALLWFVWFSLFRKVNWAFEIFKGAIVGRREMRQQDYASRKPRNV